jgi:transposase
MAKYSLETKMDAVQCYLNQNTSFKDIATKFGMHKSDVIKWVATYRCHGAEGLSSKKIGYTGEFKLSVLEYMNTNGLSARSTAAEFNIPSYTTVCSWERIFLEEGSEALFRDNRGRPKKMKTDKINNLKEESKEDLIAEVQRLRMENEYLKKLNALIQKKEKSVTKKKQ